MTILKIMLALAAGGAAYAMWSEKTKKQVKNTVKGLGKSIHEMGDEGVEKVSDKVSKEKTQHA